jgi:hypothetical protein
VEFKLPKFVLTHEVVGILDELSADNRGVVFICGCELNVVTPFIMLDALEEPRVIVDAFP